MARSGERRVRVKSRLERLGPGGLALLGLVTFVTVGGGGYYAYQTYDYVQHDNDFCMSCHLMSDPYEQFGQSAHRGLGCKACHQPTLVARTQMALTQVIENPEEISVHAEVPNERCAECHIEGDPQQWRMIANSVGHRVHMESQDSVLSGLRCVECHSTSVHAFAPVDRTCAQSGCHDDNRIELGGMGDLTIHCVACHAFVAPVDVPDEGDVARNTLDAAILPDRQECLSCHVMRTLMEMPDPDPHRGNCAACHNPHDQEDPSAAVESCATAGCHAGTDTITGFHRGLQPGTLENCLGCHEAHDFSLDGNDCASCHPDLLTDDLTMPRMPGTGPAPDTVSGVDPDALVLADVRPGWHPHMHVTGVGVLAQPPQQEQPRFLHSTHREVDCTNCHSNSDRHGGLLVRSLNDCRSCHHTEPVANSCDRCHDASDMPASPIQRQLPVSFSVSDVTQRTATFRHGAHEILGCALCHSGGLDRSAEAVDCNMCHQVHHDPENDCTSCHVSPPVSAHPPSEGHVTCTGSGCHEATPFEGVPRTRQVCLGCHQDKKDHRPDRRCVECHTLPSPRGEDGSR